MAESPLVIEARNLGKRFGASTALASLGLEVAKGECFGLLGPNGAGKSTFIGIVYGVVLRSSGFVSVFGMDPGRDASRIKRRLGVVTQDNALDESLTVAENMQIYARFEGIAAKQASERIDELLGYMNLAHRRDATIASLSGGMKRRLVFVRALLSRPELLILDEPTTGLDPAVRHLLWAKVRSLREQGTTILLTTHYMHEAEVLCDRLAIMDCGRVVDMGSPRELIQRHVPGYVAILEPGVPREKIDALKGVAGLTLHSEPSSMILRGATLEGLVAACNSNGLVPAALRPANLEDVFLHLTGKGLSNEA